MWKLLQAGWTMAPAPAKIWVAIGVVVVVLGMIAGMVYKIDQGGYNRCESKHALATLKLQEQARKEILKVEDKYDEVRKQIDNIQGDDNLVGPRVQHAIDSLPDSSGRK